MSYAPQTPGSNTWWATPLAPHYVDVTAGDTQPLRMHVDEGLGDGPLIVLLPYGEPTWSIRTEP